MNTTKYLLPAGISLPDWSGYSEGMRNELVAAFTAAVKPLAEEVALLRADNEALVVNLRGKHSLTGATYTHLIAERDRLLEMLAENQTAKQYRPKGIF
jgi:hypothetical protein